MQVPGGLPSAHLLYEQQSFIDRVLFHPTFQWSVRTLRQTQMVSVPHVQPVAKAASTFDQHSPVGASRIVAQPEHFSKHIDDAVNKARFPPSRAWKKAPPDLQAAVSLVSSYHSQPDALLARRKVVRGVVDEVVRVLQPLSSRLAAYSPEHVRALPTSINIAFVAALVVAQQWSDPLLPAKLLFGSPVVGDFPASGAFRPNVQWAKKSASKVDLFAWVEDLHSKIAERGRRSSKKAAHDARQVLRKTMEEVDGPPPQGGWVEGPFTKNDMYSRFPAGFWPSRRFGVLQKGVIRPCDDCKESWINLCSTMRESISPDAADFPAHIASLFYSVLGRKARLSGGCDDWKKAYRQIPVDDPSRSVVACWDPDSNSVVYFVVRGHVFGAVHAVNSFNAVSKFLTVSCRSLFACCGSAISCLLHGYSGKLDSALMVNAFHLYNAGLKVRVHFEYVESKANVADLPSRQEFTYLLLSLAAKRVPTFIHPAGTWSGPLKRFLLDASSGEEGVPERPRSTRARSRSRRPGHQR